jgi:hypothetical protein
MSVAERPLLHRNAHRPTRPRAEVGFELFAEIPDHDDDVFDPGAGQRVEQMRENGTARDVDQRLRASPRVRAEAPADSGGGDQRARRGQCRK